MASLHKDPRGKSPYWYCAYRAADGRRLFRSTGQEQRSDALEFCLNLEKAEKQGAKRHLTEARARELISDTVERVTGKPLLFKKTREWLDGWLESKTKANELSPITRIIYRGTLNTFLKNLGEKADLDLTLIVAEDIQRFKEQRISEGLTAKTIDRDLKVLRSAFKAARTHGLISFDPSQAISLISRVSKRKSQVVKREIFTAEELDKIVNAAADDWKTAILIGRYTGARLGDCVRMSWKHVHLDQGVIEFSDNKTEKDYRIPIHPRLEKHLMELAGNDSPNGSLCPVLAGKKPGGKSGLSLAFRKIMAKAGVDDKRVDTKAVNKNKEDQRQLAQRSFHSIRHTYNSQLANAGTSQEIRRKLVGHTTDDMNDIYTHLDDQLFREAIKKLD